MWARCTRLCVAYRTVRSRTVAEAAAPRPAPRVGNGYRAPLAPVVLDNFDAVAPAATQSAAAATRSEEAVTARQLWHATQVARANRHVRRTQNVCVVGGAAAIRRIWREYKIAPHVVYVPDTEPVPRWCLEPALPAYVVRASPVAVRRRLLSAEYSDGYAAEFPLPASRLHALADLLEPNVGTAQNTRNEDVDVHDAAAADEEDGTQTGVSGAGGGRVAVGAMMVLVGLRIPSNVGLLVRAAQDMGYDTVLLVDCVDVFQEKVLRASEGTALAPALRLFERPASLAQGPGEGAEVAGLLSEVARVHGLLPLIAVPSQAAAPAFDVARRLHAHSEGSTSSGNTCDAVAQSAVGRPMLVLGAESQGVHALLKEPAWRVPYQTVTLPLTNPFIDSYNVAVAGSILAHMFRPSARTHYDKLCTLIGDPPRQEEQAQEEEAGVQLPSE